MTPASKVEIRRTLEAPAVYANRFFIFGRNEVLRITFTEQGTTDEEFFVRSVVCLSISDAIAFNNLLAETLKQVTPAASETKQ